VWGRGFILRSDDRYRRRALGSRIYLHFRNHSVEAGMSSKFNISVYVISFRFGFGPLIGSVFFGVSDLILHT